MRLTYAKLVAERHAVAIEPPAVYALIQSLNLAGPNHNKIAVDADGYARLDIGKRKRGTCGQWVPRHLVTWSRFHHTDSKCRYQHEDRVNRAARKGSWRIHMALLPHAGQA
jgi:hypothetical protein